VSQEALETIQCTPEIAFASERIMGNRNGPVYGNLNRIASTSRGQKSSHFICNQSPVGEDGKAHPVTDNALEKALEIFPKKRLAALKANINYSASLQFIKKCEPFRQRQIVIDITLAGEMTAIFASQIAPAGDFQVQRPRSSHDLHATLTKP